MGHHDLGDMGLEQIIKCPGVGGGFNGDLVSGAQLTGSPLSKAPQGDPLRREYDILMSVDRSDMTS
jgi:hypothetical protein